jgi:DNA-binding transcriptional ArsR family regulator
MLMVRLVRSGFSGNYGLRSRFSTPLRTDHLTTGVEGEEGPDPLGALFQDMLVYAEGRLPDFQEGCWAVLRMIWHLIPENLDVVVPYADLLRQSIKFDLESTKPRRDFQKLLALIYASAILHYPFRPKIQYNGRVILVATEEDLKELLPVLGQVLKQTITGLSEKHERIINFLRKWKEDSETKPVMPWPTAKEIAEGLGMNPNTLRNHDLPHLVRKGYVYVEKDGRVNRYAQPRKLLLEFEVHRLPRGEVHHLYRQLRAFVCEESEEAVIPVRRPPEIHSRANY